MTFGSYNKMNMFGMDNMFGMGNMFGGTNVVSQLFSGTNSIFSGFNMFDMGGYGSGNCGLFMDCKGNYNYDAMAGFAVGGALLNIGGMALSQGLQARRERLADEAKAMDTTGLEKELSAKLKELGSNATIDNYKEIKIDQKFENKIAEIDNKINDYKKPVFAARGQNESEELYNKRVEKYNEQLEKYDRKIEELKTQKEEAEAAKEKEEQRIAALKQEIKDLQTKIRQAQKLATEKLFDKADGNKLSRTRQQKYLEKFDENGNLKTDAELDKGDLKRALYNYLNSSDEEKEKYRNQFIAIYDKLGENIEERSGMREAYDKLKAEQKASE